MKKQTFLYKLTNWLAALGFAAVCGCLAIVNKQVEKAEGYTVQKAQQSVSFSKAELYSCVYPYITYDMTYQYDCSHDYIIYNNNRYDIDVPNSSDVALTYRSLNDDRTIDFSFDDEGRFIRNGLFQYGLTIYSLMFAENMQKSTTLSASQLNSNTFEYFGNALNDLSNDNHLQNSYIIYNNRIFKFEEYDSIEYLEFKNGNDTIDFVLNTSDDLYCKFYYYDYDLESATPFTNTITIYSNYIADNLYAPFTDGDDIIGGITSGLGLISYLATTFLNGFTGLFWQNNALTNFAMYSLIMLGIAITFSIIKLVLNILRSNTGA